MNFVFEFQPKCYKFGLFTWDERSRFIIYKLLYNILNTVEDLLSIFFFKIIIYLDGESNFQW